MARNTLTRNLRDGVLSVEDGAAASVTLTLEEGDLQWTETDNTVEILDRGNLSHTRPGDQTPCELSYSLMYLNLIGATQSADATADEFYEMVRNKGATYTTTSAAGEQFTLRHRFTVNKPGTNGKNEMIVFEKVYSTSRQVQEAADSNVIRFSGRDFETAPTVMNA